MTRERPTRTAFKIGAKKFGTLCTWPDGLKALIVRRTPRDLYKGGNAYLSHALAAGEAMWSVETMLLSKMRLRGVHAVGIHETKSGAYYLASLATWIQHGVGVNKRIRNGSAQRSLPLQRFLVRPGKIKL